MKKLKLLTFFVILTSLTNCASTSNIKPKVDTSDRFKVDSVVLKVSQKVIPKITYHTELELQNLLTNKINELLQEENLLSNQETDNTLKIEIRYKRNFVGDATPFPSDSLAYPHYGYEIKVLDGINELINISDQNLAFQGGMVMNFKVIAGSLREKSDEIIFINAIAEEIVQSIQTIRN